MEEEINTSNNGYINLSDYMLPTSNSSDYILPTANSISNYFTTSSTNITSLTTGSTDRMIITSNGTVGIGTISANEHRLNIVGGQKSFKFLRGYGV